MRISFVSLFYPDDTAPLGAGEAVDALDSPREYLERFPLYLHLPRAVALRDHDVEFVQLYRRAAEFVLGGVTYRFVTSSQPARRIARAAAAASGHQQAHFEPSARVAAALRSPDVVHVHGTQLHLNTTILRRRLASAALVLHYHGGFPPRNRILRAVQRRNFSAAEALLFTCSEQAAAFIEAGMLREPEKVHEFVETSSAFRPRRTVARLSGNPVFVSACRLHPIKDPLTTLKGFERILEFHPEAQLHHFYRADDLLPELRDYVFHRPELRGRVHFCGSRPYPEMEAIFSGSDVLLQSSLREFSGCAILDAMACGVVPVLSDIPSFRKITGSGAAGELFEPGSADALADRVRRLGDLSERKAAVRTYFDRELSFRAMAEHLETIYEGVVYNRMAHA